MSAQPLGSPTAGLDRIRVLPIPDWRPAQIDSDEMHLADPPVGHENLVLDLVFPPRPDRTGPPGPAISPSESGAEADRSRPDPSVWAGRMGLALVEVATGWRPATQVMRWTSAAVYETLLRRRASGLHRGPVPRPPLALRAVTVCRPRAGVVEASVLVADGRRVRAVALRLRGRQRRWVVDALELG